MNVSAEIIGNIDVQATLGQVLSVTAELADQSIDVTAELTGDLDATAEWTDNLEVDADLVNKIRVSHEGYADYTGDYEVTSFTAAPLLTTSLVLPTNDKHMLDDVTVYSVPTSEEYNDAGGVTFTIGG